MNLFVDDRLFITKTKNKGFGIFTKENILPNTVIEISPAQILKNKNFITDLKKIKIWCYDWNQKAVGLSAGFGPLYNHNYNPNVAMSYLNNKYFKFTTTKEILKNEELFINYGSTWWKEPKEPEAKIEFSEKNIHKYIYISNLVKIKNNNSYVLKASENIKKGTIVEISRCLFFKIKIKNKNDLSEILFLQENKNYVLGFGYSNLYKINKKDFNIDCFIKNKKLHFIANQDIKKGQTLKISSKNIKKISKIK